jgi:CHAD domain-containing protein
MRTLARPLFAIRRPVAALRQQWPLAIVDDVEGIHQTRVASRRLREWVPVLASDPIPREPAALRRRLRDVTRLLGPSRELDVAGVSLAAIASRSPKHAAAVAIVKGHVERERARAGRARRQESRAIDIEDLAARTRRLAGLVRSPDAIRGCAARAAARLDRRARQLQQSLLGAGLVFAPGPLHRVRIALKKLRYALEVAACLGRFRLAGSLQRLKRMQNLLGELHDLQVLAGHARDAMALAPASRRASIDALVTDIDGTIRGLHSRFVTERGSLVAVLARATYVRDMLGTLPAPGDALIREGRRARRPHLREDR